MKKLLLFFVITIFGFSAKAQDMSFKGSIFDTEDAPMIGGNIVLMVDDVIKYQAVAELDGSYEIKEIAAGKYQLKNFICRLFQRIQRSRICQ